MSNTVYFQLTEFVDLPQQTKTYGYRVFDDYEAVYSNFWETLPADDLEFLSWLKDENDEKVQPFLDHLRDWKCGCYINDTEYEWDQIRHIIG